MELNKFLMLISDALEYEGVLNIDDHVSDIEGWDSLGILSIVAMLDSMGVAVNLGQFERIKTIRELFDTIGAFDDSVEN